MPLIRFTDNIQRHVKCPPQTLEGRDLRTLLDAYFQTHSAARSYILDEQGALRKHMAIFINGKPIADRQQLTDPIPSNATVDIMQALSGG